jgi:hypothetical protein
MSSREQRSTYYQRLVFGSGILGLAAALQAVLIHSTLPPCLFEPEPSAPAFFLPVMGLNRLLKRELRLLCRRRQKTGWWSCKMFL